VTPNSSNWAPAQVAELDTGSRSSVHCTVFRIYQEMKISQVPVLTPVILASQEAEIRKIKVQS
jgi:hypothetical protein